MAKKRAAKKDGMGPDTATSSESKKCQQLLGKWLPEVPPAVQKAVNKFDDLYEQQSQLKTEVKAAKKNAIALMEEHELQKVRLRSGEYLCVKLDKKLIHKSAEALMKDNELPVTESEAADVE